MKKKILSLLLGFGLVLSGCTSIPSASSSSNPTPVDENTALEVKGNGETWPTEVKRLIEKVYDGSVDDFLPLVNTEFYDAYYSHTSYDENDGTDVEQTEIVCYSSKTESVPNTSINEFIDKYAEYFTGIGYEVDKSSVVRYGLATAQKKLYGNTYQFVNFGKTIVATSEDGLSAVYSYYVSVGETFYVSTQGFVGDYLEAWPSTEIAETLGRDFLEPETAETEISYFGGFNLIEGTTDSGDSILLDVYVIWKLGTTEDDFDGYVAKLSEVGYSIQYDENNEPWGAYDVVSGIMIEIVYSSQTGFGSGVLMFAYVASDPFDAIEEIPETVSKDILMPDLTPGYYTETESETAAFQILVFKGCTNEILENYKNALTEAGWTVELSEGVYIAQKDNYAMLFYMEVLAELGECLVLQIML